ncbi:hypothetical protein SAMN05216378_1379 [Paenibacillus catalpae]|uniref:Uncharacterized protein n=1 Tax=Paenibacillus catalpae TaxID=1045775 RepID=A0A1I1V3I0_9BACL|nr:hypothetical protein [Paenibacillus catalpae]SFD77602.1 hypothetical protein SAMN05216378_1379 [Paenibacillus catalpae]
MITKFKELRDYILEKWTAKMNKPVSEKAPQEQTIGELIFENSLYE